MGIIKIVKYTKFNSGEIIRNIDNNKVGIVIKSCFLNYEDSHGREVTDYNTIYYEVFWVNNLRKRKSNCYMCEYGYDLGDICEVQCELENKCQVCCNENNWTDDDSKGIEGCADCQKRKNCHKCDGCRILMEWQENCIQRTKLLGFDLGKCYDNEDKDRCCMIEYRDGIKIGAYYLVWDGEDKGNIEDKENGSGEDDRCRDRYRYVREDRLERVKMREIKEEK